MSEFDEAMSARKLHRISLPADLPDELTKLAQCFAAATCGAARNARSVARESRAPRCEHTPSPAALGEFAVAAWIVAHVPELPVTEHFAWMTGWCSTRMTARCATHSRRASCITCCASPTAPTGDGSVDTA
jgi:V/A-type H+/Na+-transporting ATPase subunit I